MWHCEEELCYSIELIASMIKCRVTVKHGGPLWTEKQLYICSHQLSRGQTEFEKSIQTGATKLAPKKQVAIAG
jgi:hypothetical protein